MTDIHCRTEGCRPATSCCQWTASPWSALARSARPSTWWRQAPWWRFRWPGKGPSTTAWPPSCRSRRRRSTEVSRSRVNTRRTLGSCTTHACSGDVGQHGPRAECVLEGLRRVGLWERKSTRLGVIWLWISWKSSSKVLRSKMNQKASFT